MKKPLLVALAGVMTALSVLLLQLGAWIWLFAYLMPLLCGVLMIAVCQSADAKTAWLIYAAVSVLSVVLLNDKESALLYVLFFGYYPMVREKLRRIRHGAVQYVVKLLIFNAGVVAAELIVTFVLGVPFDLFLGKWSAPLLLLMANLIFAIYERLLGMLTVIYAHKYKPRIDKYLK